MLALVFLAAVPDVGVAIPPMGPTPVPVGVPKTGFMIESMVTATAHNIASLLRGEEPPDPEGGWGALHQVAQDESASAQHLKLLSPQPQVERVLERSGMSRFFETYTDLAEALGSF